MNFLQAKPGGAVLGTGSIFLCRNLPANQLHCRASVSATARQMTSEVAL